MKKAAENVPDTRSWRDIPQEITPGRMSRIGRRRLMLAMVRTLGGVVLLGILGWGGWKVWRTLQDDPHRLAGTTPARPVEEVVLHTNGALDQAWVEATLDLDPAAGLMELDLYDLRSRLTVAKQVRTAVLVREFPATLQVTLDERIPVVRMQARLGGPDPRVFLVARDGTVFEGQGHDRAMVRSLPWLGGVRLVRAGEGFEPLAGIDHLAKLLNTARDGIPDRYGSWRVVSLEHMARDGQILVQTREVPEIIFGVREDFHSQIARLDLILDEIGPRSVSPVRSINLAVGTNQVPVAFNSPAAAPSLR